MKLTLRPTDQVVVLEAHAATLGGPAPAAVPARIWEGHDDNGFPVVAFISRVAVRESEAPEVHERFARELSTCEKLRPSHAWDLRYFVD